MSDKFCFVFTTDAFDSASMDEGIDMAFAAAAFDQQVTVVLAGHNTCLAHQSNQSGHRLIKKLKSLSIYGIETLYVLNDSAELLADWHHLSTEDFAAIVQQSDQTMVF